MNKINLFQEKVKIATDFMIQRLSQGFSFKLVLKRCEILTEKLIQINNSLTSTLELCCEDDIKPLADFYEEIEIHVDDRPVEISYVLHLDLNKKLLVDFAKVEGIIVTESEAEKFKTSKPPNLRYFESLARIVIADAVKFGVEWAIGRF